MRLFAKMCLTLAVMNLLLFDISKCAEVVNTTFNTRLKNNQTSLDNMSIENNTINGTTQTYSLNGADSAWVMVSSCMVMLMTPALGFFYAGFVDKNTFVLVVAQCLIIYSIITVFWTLLGFSLAFGESKGIIGGIKYAALQNIDYDAFSYAPTIPALLFYFFQNKFAAITPAIIIGSTAGRLSLFSIIIFCSIWSVISYCPIAFWNWNSDGFLRNLGSIDFAGGNVVHISSGFAGLATAIVCDRLEKIDNIQKKEKARPSTLIVMLGTSLLWFGWFGFNGGSSLAANGQGVLALVNTNLAGATALATFGFISYLVNKIPSVNDMCLGTVCGLVGITPGAGYVPVYAAGIIGAVTAAVCYLACYLKEKYQLFDDRLDAFGCHGVGGVVGGLLTGLFSVQKFAGTNGAFYGNVKLLGYQCASISVSASWSFATSILILIGMYYSNLIYFHNSNTEEFAKVDIKRSQIDQRSTELKKVQCILTPRGMRKTDIVLNEHKETMTNNKISQIIQTTE